MKQIKIKPANNGWIVDIGCQTFVSEDKDKMLKEIGRYIDNPTEVEKEYMKNPKNRSEEPVPEAPRVGHALSESPSY